MNVNFQTVNKGGKAATTEWYTPSYIIEALGGKFDLDPCAPQMEWHTAHKCYTKEIDGLSQTWEGRVFLNPPYENPTVKHFVRRLADHGNGIALLYARCDNKMFFEDVFNPELHLSSFFATVSTLFVRMEQRVIVLGVGLF